MLQYDLKESFSCYYLISGKGKKIYQKGVLLLRERELVWLFLA